MNRLTVGGLESPLAQPNQVLVEFGCGTGDVTLVQHRQQPLARSDHNWRFRVSSRGTTILVTIVPSSGSFAAVRNRSVPLDLRKCELAYPCELTIDAWG